MSDIYLIKDLAHISGHSVDTIKYYLKIGLIKATGKTPETNIRYFDTSTVDMLKQIRTLRLEGKSLAQITKVLPKK